MSRCLTCLASLILGALTLLPVAGGVAQERGSSTSDVGSEAEQPAHREHDAAVVERARRAFDLGRRAYGAGHFRRALRHFEASYALTEAAELLYNLGLVHEQLGHDTQALDAFRRYMQTQPQSEERQGLESRVSELEARMSGQETVDGTQAPNTSSNGAANESALALGLVGAGALTSLVGGLFLTLTLVDMETVSAGVDWQDIQGAYDRVPYFSTLGFTLAGVGLGALATGLLSWGLSESSEEALEVSLYLGPANIHLRGRF